MPWFKLDDSFHSHPKVIAAGNEAIGLYVRCGTYAAQHLTDGFIPEPIALLYGSDALAETLVRVKLWRRARGGWRMPDYLDYNPSREDVVNKRRVRAEAGHKGGVASGKARSKPEANASPLLEPPARPGPNGKPPAPSGRVPPKGGTTRRTRGTRLPSDFTVTPDMKTWFADHCPGVNGLAEHAKFCDYWRAKPGRAGLKLDWAATWRNWMRRAAEQQEPHRRNGRQQETDEMFNRALQRARARDQEAQGDPRGNGSAYPLRPGVLPAAGDR